LGLDNIHARRQGKVSRRKDGKNFVYLPKSVVEDSAFPFKLESSVAVRIVIDPKGEKILILPVDEGKGRLKKKD
jgi:hypothetical protein